MHGESGQATVEWTALLLLAALILGTAATHASGQKDRDLGEAVAKRIASAPSALERAPAGATPAATADAPAPRAAAPAPGALAPASRARVDDAFRRLRRVAAASRHAWAVCLGYRRWRQELAHPRLLGEVLPLRDALAIANSCLNPYDFLFEE